MDKLGVKAYAWDKSGGEHACIHTLKPPVEKKECCLHGATCPQPPDPPAKEAEKSTCYNINGVCKCFDQAVEDECERLVIESGKCQLSFKDLNNLVELARRTGR